MRSQGALLRTGASLQPGSSAPVPASQKNAMASVQMVLLGVPCDLQQPLRLIRSQRVQIDEWRHLRYLWLECGHAKVAGLGVLRLGSTVHRWCVLRRRLCLCRWRWCEGLLRRRRGRLVRWGGLGEWLRRLRLGRQLAVHLRRGRLGRRVRRVVWRRRVLGLRRRRVLRRRRLVVLLRRRRLWRRVRGRGVRCGDRR